MHKLVQLHKWRESGQLQLRVAYPSQVLVDALDALSEGITAREVYEVEKAEKQAHAESRKRSRKP